MAVTRYTYAGPGHLVSEDRGGTKRFYRYDARGSTSQLIDSASSITDTFGFSYFGTRTAHTGSTATPRQWRSMFRSYTTQGGDGGFPFVNFSGGQQWNPPPWVSGRIEQWDPGQGIDIGIWPRPSSDFDQIWDVIKGLFPPWFVGVGRIPPFVVIGPPPGPGGPPPWIPPPPPPPWIPPPPPPPPQPGNGGKSGPPRPMAHRLPFKGPDIGWPPGLDYSYGAYCGSNRVQDPGLHILPQDCIDACCLFHDRCLEGHYAAGFDQICGHKCCDCDLRDCVANSILQGCCDQSEYPGQCRGAAASILAFFAASCATGRGSLVAQLCCPPCLSLREAVRAAHAMF